MKINELKAVNEGIGDFVSGMSSALIGDQATSAISGLLSGTGPKAKLAQNIFLKDFSDDAIISLTNGIKSGVIDKTLVTPDENKPTAPSTENPSDSDKKQQSRPSDDRSVLPIDKDYANAVNSVRSIQSGSKKLPDAMSSSLSSEIKNARYNKDFAIRTGKKIVALANRGYDVSSLKTQWQSMASLGKKQGTVQENSYSRLNHVFESIIEVAEAQDGTRSIAQYMLEWFEMYMSGTNWTGYKSKIAQICKNIEVAYQAGKNWKAAIRLLGSAALTIPGVLNAKGVDDIRQQITRSSPSNVTSPQEIEKQLVALKTSSPEVFDAAVKKIQSR